MTSVVHPRENTELFGHEAAEAALQRAFASSRMAHAWLIAGPRGIGKATLAYRFARAALSTRPISLPEGEGDARIAQNAHPNLKAVEAIREVEHFLRLTAADGGAWRIVIIDSADEMNRNAANALLKILEEPAPQTVLMLISHAPGSLLPTIRSRCRILPLSPLDEAKGMQAMERLAPGLEKNEAAFASALSGGSPGLALQLYEGRALALYRTIIAALASAPEMDMSVLHGIAASVAGKEALPAWRTFGYVMTWLVAQIVFRGAGVTNDTEWAPKENAVFSRLTVQHPADRLAEMWEKLRRSAEDSERFSLDRSASALAMLHALH